jgi:light-regulated signal transduction histidine kinase (bacteriophytochrome)
MRTRKIFERLSNGHHLAMYITKHRSCKNNIAYIVAVCIFRSKRECNYWFRHQEQVVSKDINTWGMEGMLKAIQWLKELGKNICPRESIVIYWVDERRRRAFKFLQRYGYVESEYLDRPCYILKKS